ncbi:MAG: N-acetylglucosamine-6-phosphate deacetylase [Simkania sp.]|nr:N-acetylglucosamine-6-phosphate deacetylase [Simkania sp.]
MQKFLLIAVLCFMNTYLFSTESLPCVSVFATPEDVGEATAQKIMNLILDNQKKNKKTVLGLATGSTVIPVYTALKALVQKHPIDLSNVITFNLDEYVGLPSFHPQSFRSFMFSHLFDALLYSADNPQGIKLENIHIPNGTACTEEDLSTEEFAALSQQFPHRTQGTSLTQEESFWILHQRALYYEMLITQLGPIDLQILGIGRNGHIGFVEPETPLSTKTLMVQLSETTRQDNAHFFDENLQIVPQYALTMGTETILQSKEILLLATGAHKAEIVDKTLKEPISSAIPSTALRWHRNVSFFLDQDASSLLNSPPNRLVKRFYNAYLLLDHKIQEGELWVSEGKIVPPQKEADIAIDVQGALLAPGFIDIQINGGFGCDFSRNPESIDLVAKRLPLYGVTAFLPTVISSSPDQYRQTLPLLQPRVYGNSGAAILGIHLEGPYFSTTYRGAHNPQYIRPVFDETTSIDQLYGSLQGVKLVTLAPEIPGALHLIQYLKQHHILVSAGHSGASFDQMKAGIDAGVGLVTHLFNAMPSYHHRNQSIISSALISPSLPYSLIADGIHLSPETLSLCWRCNPDGLILVSDSSEALGLPNGNYRLGTMDIEVTDGKVYLAGTQTIAASTLSLDQAVRHLCSMTNCSVVQALEAASLKPAQLIHAYPSKGTLDVGADADFVILTPDLHVKASYIGGELYKTP